LNPSYEGFPIADDIFKLFSNQFFLLTRQVRVTVSFDIWGISSVGRARAQHARGLGFDSQILHFEKIFHISPNADLNYRPCHY
jgi:hypothetical protein